MYIFSHYSPTEYKLFYSFSFSLDFIFLPLFFVLFSHTCFVFFSLFLSFSSLFAFLDLRDPPAPRVSGRPPDRFILPRAFLQLPPRAAHCPRRHKSRSCGVSRNPVRLQGDFRTSVSSAARRCWPAGENICGAISWGYFGPFTIILVLIFFFSVV